MNSSVTTYLNTFVYKWWQRHIVRPTEEEEKRFFNDSTKELLNFFDEETMSAYTIYSQRSAEKITINDADT